MSQFTVHNLTVKKIHDGLVAKQFSAVEITEAYLKEIEARDSQISAFLTVNRESSLAQAKRVDEQIAGGGKLAPLAGVPVAIKDNILITGEQATAGSKILKNYKAVYDAGVIKKLKGEQAIFIGKTNLDEFAMGSSTENSAYQTTKNPHDTTRVPGGSSGGSAAAVAANFAPVALGSDTGGSIRQPAHFCGVVGLKPTYGAVSRSGLIALSSSLDQIGPFTKTVEDAALVFSAIAGKDQYDNTSVEVKYDEQLTIPNWERVKKLKVGIPKEYFIDGIEPEVRKAIDATIDFYKKQGVEFKEISLPHTKYALSCYYIIQPAEASSNLARFDGIRYAPVDGARPLTPERSDGGRVARGELLELYTKSRSIGFGPETTRRVILGTFVLSSGYYDAYYKKAIAVKEMITHDFMEAFKEVDVILTPVAPTRAFKIGEKANDPLAMYLSDILTIPVNLAGLPAISIPVRQVTGDKRQVNSNPMSHITVNNPLPIGFQLIGKHFREADILGLGMLYEKA